LVVGKDQYEKEQQMIARGEAVFGPLVLEAEQKALRSEKKNELGPVVTEAATPTISLAAGDVIALLKQSPDDVDAILEAELARPDGPRKAALEALYDAEDGGKARPEVINRIMDELEKFN
jgi:hypothetical protein